jgi:hypothetical protein
MKITYISCDGVSEVTEEVNKIEFFESITNGKTFVQCTRAEGNQYADHPIFEVWPDQILEVNK